MIEGVFRAMPHQLVRHRLVSYSHRSPQYVDHKDFDYVVPPQLRRKTLKDDGQEVDAAEYFADTMGLIADRYAKPNTALGWTGEGSYGTTRAKYTKTPARLWQLPQDRVICFD